MMGFHHITLFVWGSIYVSFTNHLLGHGGLHAWLAMLPDLTPLDYHLWGHMRTYKCTKQRLIQEQQCFVILLQQQSTYATNLTTICQLPTVCWCVLNSAQQHEEETEVIRKHVFSTGKWYTKHVINHVKKQVRQYCWICKVLRTLRMIFMLLPQFFVA
jgi:UDP-N-acetylmuramoylalanine-D-glutamate ligase